MPIYPIRDRRTGKSYKMRWDGPDPPDRESVKKFIFDEENKSVFDKVKSKIGDIYESPSTQHFLFGPSKEEMPNLVTPGFGESSLLPEMEHGKDEGWPTYLAKGAYNQLVRPLASGSGMLGSSVPGKLPQKSTFGAATPPASKLGLGTGRTVEAGPSVIDAEFSTLPDIELPPAPTRQALPPAPTDLTLPPGRPPFYSGRRGVSQNLEDVGEIQAPASRQLEYTRGPGINVMGGLEDIPEFTPPAPKRQVVKPKAPTPKGVEDVTKRPFIKVDDADVEFLANSGDEAAIAEAALRPTLRDKLKHLFKDEGGFLGKRPKDVGVARSDTAKSFKEVYDDLATSGLTVIRNAGGKDLQRLIQRNRLDAEQLAGRINTRLKEITSQLTSEELSNYIDVRDINATPLNDKVKTAFEQFKEVDKNLTDLAKKAGVGVRRGKKITPFEPLGEEGKYFAHIYPPEFFKDKPKALDAIMSKGYTLDQAERILKKASEFGERLIDPQHGRIVNAPGYRKDINVDYQHVNDMTRRITQAIDFGPLDTADAGSPISRMIAATDEPVRVGKIVKRYLGREEPMNPAWARVNHAVVQFQAATKLSKFLLNNIAQAGTVPMRAGFKNTGKALGEMFADYRGARNQAELTGALQPIYNELVKEVGGPSGIARWYGIAKGEEINRTLSSVAGKHTAKDLFRKLKKDPGNMKVRAQLEDLVLEDPGTLSMQKGLTDWQINRAGARMSEVTQGRASNIDLPKLWSDHPSMRLVMLYKRYAFQQSKNLKEAFKIMGPVKTAAVVFGTGQILGEGIGDVNAVLRGTGASIGNGTNTYDEIVKAIEDRGEGYERIINNLAQSWALGYVGDLMESAGRGRGKVTASLAGPIIGDIDEAASGVGNLDARGLAAMGARTIPFFGTGIASGIRSSEPTSRRRRRARTRR